jgi:nitrogen regulatory protein PII-like uncharacterized protein
MLMRECWQIFHDAGEPGFYVSDIVQSSKAAWKVFLSVSYGVLFAAKLVPVGFGIKKLQITCVIEDSKVESMDAIIEEELVRCGHSLLQIRRDTCRIQER